MKLLVLTGTVLLISFADIGAALKSDCILTWKSFPNNQVKNLIQQSGITSESDCKVACAKKEDCWNLDWNFKDNNCWFGDVHNPEEKVPDNTVNHYDLNCEVKTTLPPTDPPTTALPTPPPPTDCSDIHRSNPEAKSGVYAIKVAGISGLVSVYCDMDTACGGWTVFQRRKDGTVKFLRGWDDYANGFGDLSGEFWLGNNIISALTSANTYRLRVDLENLNGVRTAAEYTNFKVAGAEEKYKLTFNNCSYIGNAGNALGGDQNGVGQSHNGMKFSTIDQDNDNHVTESCAKNFHGAWWYNKCHSANLNGEYKNTVWAQGVNWNKLDYSYKGVEMKIR